MVVYFHRNLKLGYSINKVTQTIVKHIEDKKEFYVPEHLASLKAVIKNIYYVRKKRDKHAINHITGDIHYCMLGLIGCYSVLTIHDTVPLDFNKGSILKNKIIEWLWYRLPIMIATKVICISNATRDSISRFTDRKDIEVIYDSIEICDLYTKELIQKEKPRILIIGTKKNKNLERTFLALQGLPVHLVIIGRLTNNQISELDNCSIEYENRFDLSDDDIINEYRNADILSFISLFEGFGMPIIEANQQGIPVISSNIPVIKEVAGDSALLVDPYNIEDIHDAFVKLIMDINLRRELVMKGYENIKRFDVKLNLAKLQNVYEKILRKQ